MNGDRFEDRVDDLVDRLADARDLYERRSGKLVRLLEIVRSDYDREIVLAATWAVREGLIPAADWRDESGEPFLPVARLQVIREIPPDAATMLRERAATLKKDEEGDD